MNSSPAPESAELEVGELVRLAAIDNKLFGATFFPKTFRQKSPAKHEEIWAALDDPTKRFVLLRAARDSAKTTLLRVFTAKRAAYNISRTILYVGASEPHAQRSLMWIRNQIERNHLFAGTYGLRPGKKWNENELEIIHGVDDSAPIWVLGAGITGNVRGINFDDYRPDLIVLDDVLTDENAATAEQREKLVELILGAIAGSLAPRSDEPNAKMVMAQTPLHKDDAGERAAKSSAWHTVSFPCWTPETMFLPVDQQISAWPERVPTEEMRQKKRDYTAQNKLSVFLREYECRIGSPETSAFMPQWLRHWTVAPKPGILTTVLAIDPVPPPSDRAVEKGLHENDFEAITVSGRMGEDYFCLEHRLNRGHQPNWTLATTFELAMKWRTTKWIVETVAYQRTLVYLLREEMKRRRMWYAVFEEDSKMKKYIRIKNVLSGIAANGHLYCDPAAVELIEMWEAYPSVPHDDLLDSYSIGLKSLINPYLELSEEDVMVLEDREPQLQIVGRAP